MMKAYTYKRPYKFNINSFFWNSMPYGPFRIIFTSLRLFNISSNICSIYISSIDGNGDDLVTPMRAFCFSMLRMQITAVVLSLFLSIFSINKMEFIAPLDFSFFADYGTWILLLCRVHMMLEWIILNAKWLAFFHISCYSLHWRFQRHWQYASVCVPYHSRPQYHCHPNTKRREENEKTLWRGLIVCIV